ncbi:MAG: flavin reductase family protein [Chitinivibrionales bacterium]|nr:flavin reductase family protein [Chitinivibrionales bacterium]
MKRSLGAKTIGFPTPVFLVGTYDEQEKPNIMAAAWGGICCSDPPRLCVSLREATYSHAAIAAREAFTVSIASERQVAEADYAGIASGRKVDKFDKAGLTPVHSTLTDAPYVEQCPVVIECKLVHTLNLGLHTQFVGEILDVKADETVVDDHGAIDMTKVAPFVYIPGSRTYHSLGRKLADAFRVGRELMIDD